MLGCIILHYACSGTEKRDDGLLNAQDGLVVPPATCCWDTTTTPAGLEPAGQDEAL